MPPAASAEASSRAARWIASSAWWAASPVISASAGSVMPSSVSRWLRRVSSMMVSRCSAPAGSPAVGSTASAGAPSSDTDTSSRSATAASVTRVLAPCSVARVPTTMALACGRVSSQSPSSSNKATLPIPPSAKRGSHAACWALLPPASRPWMASCVLVNGVASRWRPIGSAITAVWPSVRPLPPKRSGMAMPFQPSWAISLQMARSKPVSVVISCRTVAAGDRSRQKVTALSSSMACSSLKAMRLDSGGWVWSLIVCFLELNLWAGRAPARPRCWTGSGWARRRSSRRRR